MGGTRGGRAAGRIVAAVVVAALLIGWWAVDSTVWCDGVYHRFQIPDDYDGFGCTRIIPAWHAIFPWNWDRTELVCTGLCPPDVPLWTPDG